jgi:hypothetical protein
MTIKTEITCPVSIKTEIKSTGGTVVIPSRSMSTVLTSQAVVVHTPGASVPNGENPGDIIRWNAALGVWQSKGEPFEFQGVLLTPTDTALLNREGYFRYDRLSKSIVVCTNGE